MLTIAVLLLALPGTSNTYGYGVYYRYAAPYPYYGYPYRPDTDVDFARLRRELRRQQVIERGQLRQQEQELNLLRDQAFAKQNISARQACHYRTTGGFEICADLFVKASPEFNACEALVVQRNPGCNDPPLDAGR